MLIKMKKDCWALHNYGKGEGLYELNRFELELIQNDIINELISEDFNDDGEPINRKEAK